MEAQPAIAGLFDERLGRRPYATDTLLYGVRMMAPAVARRRRYIQANPPHLRAWSLFDIDRPGGGLAWEDQDLPMPSWVCVNRTNEHAHLSYGIEVPVLLGDYNGLDRPIRYLAALETAMRVKLGADPGYSGLITKNPHRSDVYRVLWGHRLYALGDLQGYLGNLSKYRLPANEDPLHYGLGRNVGTFHALREFAYRAIREYWGERGGFVHFLASLHTWGQEFTGNEHTPPLDYREVHYIAKSVARWTWARFTPAGFSEWQRQVGRKGAAKAGKASGQSRRAETAERDALIVSRVLAGESRRAVAREAGIALSTVQNIVRRVTDERHIR